MPRVSKKKITEPVIEEKIPLAPVKKSRVSPSLFVMGLLLCIALGIAGYFFYQYKHTAEVMQREEIENLVSVIGKSMALPQGEFPTLATVTNKEKLDDQPFFLRAENGDKILIYSGSGRAVLYRPSIEKIIDVTTVNIVEEQTSEKAETETAAPTESVMPSATVEETVDAAVAAALSDTKPTMTLYNGSTKVGITGPVETQVASDFPDIVIEKKEKAAKTDYAETLVIDLSETHSELAARIASELTGKVSALPSGETNPGTDMLIIVAHP